MSNRLALRSVCVAALALVLGTAVVGTASAEPPEAESPELLAAMQADLGLTPDQARQRLADDAAGAAAADRLRSSLGESWAGAWLDEGRLVVATTDAGEADAIRAEGGRPVVAARNAGELEDVQAKLDAGAGAAGEPVASWYVDPASNSVVVTSTDHAAAQAFVNSAGAGADPVRIAVVADRPVPFADLVGGEALLRVGGGRCSIGFSARSADATFVITAGHCTELGGDWTGANGELIGPAVDTEFPGDDFGAIEVTNTADWTPTNEVAGSVPVTGTAVAPIGASVCRSGSTTGFRCGTVRSFNASVNYGGGDVVRGLTRTDACAERGDSGGSFVAGTQAQGLTSGGSGDCTTGGETFFQPIEEALDRYDLTLVTG
jgi:streptogrisin C